MDLPPLIFDIETGPLSDERLIELLPPFVPPEPPGEFDPTTVKCGNIGGPTSEKGKAKIEAARTAHEASIRNHADNVEAKRASHFDDFKASAALSACTGQVVALGVMGKSAVIIGQSVTVTEDMILADFWRKYLECRSKRRLLIGHNIEGFDIPFMVRRSIILGIEVPPTVYEKTRYIDGLVFRDTMKIWQGPTRDWIGLDYLCNVLGVVRKFDGGGITGAEFYRYWFGSPEEHDLARQYLLGDLESTLAVAERMRVR